MSFVICARRIRTMAICVFRCYCCQQHSNISSDVSAEDIKPRFCALECITVIIIIVATLPCTCNTHSCVPATLAQLETSTFHETCIRLASLCNDNDYLVPHTALSLRQLQLAQLLYLHFKVDGKMCTRMRCSHFE